MKKTHRENRERKKVAELAREYSVRGYEVLAEILNYEPPYPIKGIRPDIIARKGDEIIIIEVKTIDSLKKERDHVAQLARYSKTIPGARFDLVMTNPKPQSSTYGRTKALQEELEAIHEGLLKDINEAINLQRTDLIVIFASRLLEGLLSRIAAKKGLHISSKERSLTLLSSRMAKEKIISESVREFASKLQKQRNVVIHGKEPVPYKDAIEIYNKLISLVKEWS